MQKYGSDFTCINKFLPFKTRKQIQKKYEAFAQRTEKFHRRQRREARKAYFDLHLRDNNLW